MNVLWSGMHLPIVAAVCGVIFSGLARAQEPGEYNFAPVPQYGISLTAAYWNPILAHVAEQSGHKLTLKIARTSAETTKNLLSGEVHFAFTNHLFSPERQKLGWRVFGRRNTAPLHGQLVVAGDSPITDVTQLAGQEVGFPGPEATVSYKIPYAYLLSRKIDVKVTFGGNMDAALAQLFSGRVKALGGNSQLIEGYARRENRTYRVLWSSEAVHELALMVSPVVPEREAKGITDAFLGMAKDPAGREVIRRSSKLVGLPEDAFFIPSNASEYGAYYNFFKIAPPHLR